jgi:hypothetical protein
LHKKVACCLPVSARNSPVERSNFPSKKII